MITLLELKWSNCFSYGPDNKLDLASSPVTQIIGFNGTGKSAIPLILEEVLFNKNSKGLKKSDIPNRLLDGSYYIYLKFTKEEDTYEVESQRKTTLKLKLTKNGEDISSHTATNTYKTLQEILGVDFKTFSQLVYQNTNSSLQFLTATDTNRKKFLIDLLHLEEYVSYFELFKDTVRTSTSKVDQIESSLKTVENWLDNNKLDSTSLLPMQNLENLPVEEEKEIGQLRSEIENILEKNKKIKRNLLLKTQLAAINLNEINSIKATQILPSDKLLTECGELDSVIKTATNSINHLSKLGDVCPTCDQSIPADFKQTLIAEATATIKSCATKKNEVLSVLEEVQNNNKQFTRKTKTLRDWEVLYQSIDQTLPSETLDQEELEKRIKVLSVRVSAAKARNLEIEKNNKAAQLHNTRIQVIEEQSIKFQEQLAQLAKDLEFETEILANLEVLKKAFSTNGLLAYKIENLVKELEELTNSYLGDLSDGRFTIQFVINNDKLNVEITDNGNIVGIEALSSGELARVNTGTLLAIRKLMSSISKSRLNILFLDEVISVLDESGKERLVEVLLSEPQLNTYLVSHGWTHPLLDKVRVVKDSGISHLEV